MTRMPFKKGKVTKEYSLPVAVLKGLIISYLITIPVFIVFAILLSSIEFPAGFLSPIVMVTTVISVLAAGVISARSLKSKGWISGAVTGFCYMLILYIMNGIINMKFSINNHTVTMVLIGMVTGIIGGIAGVNLKKTYKHTKISGR